MASSTLTFKDQNGNPVWGLATRLARNDWDTSRAEDERYPDKAGHTTFLEVKNVLPATNGHTVHVNYNEGLNPDWRNYSTVSKHFIDIEDPNQLNQVIVVNHIGVPVPEPNHCPVNWNKQQFTDWFNRIRVGSSVTTMNMVAMAPELVKCGFEWQNHCRNSSEWRPRIHQPPFLNGPCSGSNHDVDCGDFGGPWILTFRY